VRADEIFEKQKKVKELSNVPQILPPACGKNRLPGNCATACCPNSLGMFSLPSEQEPVGISGYVTRLTESLPKKLKGLLPSPEEIEPELSKK